MIRIKKGKLKDKYIRIRVPLDLYEFFETEAEIRSKELVREVGVHEIVVTVLSSYCERRLARLASGPYD